MTMFDIRKYQNGSTALCNRFGLSKSWETNRQESEFASIFVAVALYQILFNLLGRLRATSLQRLSAGVDSATYATNMTVKALKLPL